MSFIKPGRIVQLILIVAVINFVACEKENTPDPDPVPEVKTSEEILISKAWKIRVIRAQQSNTAYYYKRDESVSAGFNFNFEYIKFESNKTGLYVENASTQYPFTWEFANAEKTAVKYTLQKTTPLIVNWENIVFDENSLTYGEHYVLPGGTKSLAYAVRIPN